MASNLDTILDTTFDSRDVIERFEELDANEAEALDEDESEELATIKALIEELDDGTNDWPYGLQFIRDDFFEDYAEELAEDIGAIDRDAGWPLGYIDWEAAADALKMDYTSVEILGNTYWYR